MTRTDLHIGVLFPMDTVRHSLGQFSRMWGRAVANHDFLQAVAASKLYARLTVFVPTGADCAHLSSTLLAGQHDNVFIVAYKDIADHLRAHNLDVLHVPDPNLFAGTHIRNFFSERDFVVTGITHSLANQHFLAWALQNDANGVREQDCLFCTTPTAREVVESMFDSLRRSAPDFAAPQCRVLPLGVTPPASVPARETARLSLEIGDEDFVILSLCRFDHQFKMDLLPLLNTYSLVCASSDRPMRLVLGGASGDGAYLDYVRQSVAQQALTNVTFYPDCDDECKASLLGAADVFVSLSDNVQETFGLTVIEAMAAGLPVVVSDWDGYRSLVEHGTTGFLVPTKIAGSDFDWDATLALHEDPVAHLYQSQTTAVDTRCAADFILQLMQDAALADQFSAAARDRASEYRWDRVIPRYFALWSELHGEVGRTAPEVKSMRSSAVGFLRDFSGYATSRLQDSDRFLTSAAGQRVLTGDESMPRYATLEEFMDIGTIREILKFFSSENSVAELKKQTLAAGTQLPNLAGNLLWLYKRGYVEARQG